MTTSDIQATGKRLGADLARALAPRVTTEPAADPFRADCAHLDYNTLCRIVKTLSEDQDALRAALRAIQERP